MKKSRMSLEGQTAVVTGGGSGIGRAICIALAEHGASVLAAGRTEKNIKETVSFIRSAGGTADYICTDVTNSSDVTRMTERALTLYGAIDLLYNSAGICTVCDVEHMPEQWWEDTFAVNCKGVFLCAKSVIPPMKKQGKGRIISIASQAGKGASANQAHYCASKAAVIGFTRSLAMELKDTGIRVNCICPGSVMNEMTLGEAREFARIEGEDPAAILESWRAAIPLGRWVTPQDVADTAVLLASDYTDYMTGQAVNISGGQTMI
ncbi:MAG: SDR family NAD(P)-dependent oxidoreductase [Ruminococcus sp.]|jgi:meso-butanediol dehydrogenase/(S,S)-butanediol dehydrogenase/diacetyl reductase